VTTVMDRGAVTTMGKGWLGAARPSRLPTTLADLITAIQDVVGPEDDGLVVATVQHLLRSGRLTRRGTGIRLRPPQHQEKVLSQSLTGGVRHPSAAARRWLCCQCPGGKGWRGATGNAADRSPERR
jgi:hypothetical protein